MRSKPGSRQHAALMQRGVLVFEIGVSLFDEVYKDIVGRYYARTGEVATHVWREANFMYAGHLPDMRPRTQMRMKI